MMRVADPNGAWKPHPEEPRMLVRREPDDADGEFYRVLWEGRMRNYDGVTIKVAPLEGLDLNRNFPMEWVVEAERTRWSYPTSEPEIRALVQAIVDRPNITGHIAYRSAASTCGRTRGYPDEHFPTTDLRAYQPIGAKATSSGYPAVSIFHDFKYDPKQTVKGGANDWLFDHLGLFRGRPNSGAPSARRGSRTSSSSSGCATIRPRTTSSCSAGATSSWTEGLRRLVPLRARPARFGRARRLGPHVLLGEHPAPVSRAGDRAAHGVRDLAGARVAAARVAFAGGGLGDGSWLIRLVVENSGWLPTSVTEQAVQRKAVRPLEAEITLPDGGKVIGGERKVELGQLDGRVNRRSLLWWASNDATSDREGRVGSRGAGRVNGDGRGAPPARRDRSPRREPGLGAPVSEMRHRGGRDDAVELQLGRFELVEQANATAEENRNEVELELVEEPGAEVLLDDVGAARDVHVFPAALRACSSAASTPSVTKVKVVPCSSSGSRGWCVRTKTGWRNGGSSPHQPFAFGSSSQGPDPLLNIRRPMIVAPALSTPSSTTSASSPVSPPSMPWRSRQLFSRTTHSWRPSPPSPSGCSSVWFGPATKPSSETEMSQITAISSPWSFYIRPRADAILILPGEEQLDLVGEDLLRWIGASVGEGHALGLEQLATPSWLAAAAAPAGGDGAVCMDDSPRVREGVVAGRDPGDCAAALPPVTASRSRRMPSRSPRGSRSPRAGFGRRRTGSAVALRHRVFLGDPLRNAERPGVLDQLAHLLRIDGSEVDVNPVVAEVVLTRERELLGLGFDERVAPLLREREAHRRAVFRE